LKSIGADGDEPSSPRSPSPRGTSARPASGKKVKKKEALVTYLNVHAGVSIGVMAGMDVGAQDRFEVRNMFGVFPAMLRRLLT